MTRDRVLSDPAERARFLVTEEKRFVEALTQSPEAAGILRRLAGEQSDEAVRAKVEAVVEAIEAAKKASPSAAATPPIF
jgi:hypothetical protein